ncbi:unnamed protein product [Protopolystoma xenopodis]|uniref:Uncharacterized protein n=1 Tax=Protopolystoma xenopodis TaxID=117903 RepID=A0A448WVL8_9PLAT|nr:unnamed protein product [Protopolystoma xenopodis]
MALSVPSVGCMFVFMYALICLYAFCVYASLSLHVELASLTIICRRTLAPPHALFTISAKAVQDRAFLASETFLTSFIQFAIAPFLNALTLNP